MPSEAAARRQVRALSGRQTREPHHGSARNGVVRRRYLAARLVSCLVAPRVPGLENDVSQQKGFAWQPVVPPFVTDDKQNNARQSMPNGSRARSQGVRSLPPSLESGPLAIKAGPRALTARCGNPVSPQDHRKDPHESPPYEDELLTTKRLPRLRLDTEQRAAFS